VGYFSSARAPTFQRWREKALGAEPEVRRKASEIGSGLDVSSLQSSVPLLPHAGFRHAVWDEATQESWALRAPTRAALRAEAGTAFLAPNPTPARNGRVDKTEALQNLTTTSRVAVPPSTESIAVNHTVSHAHMQPWHACGHGAWPQHFCEHFLKRPDTWRSTLDTLLGAQDLQLNSSQQDAIRLSLSHSVSAIVGPPGTGKTSTASALLAVWCSLRGCGSAQGRRPQALAVASSNVAVDQLLERLVKAGISAVRVGEAVRVSAAVQGRTLEVLADARECHDLRTHCSMTSPCFRLA